MARGCPGAGIAPTASAPRADPWCTRRMDLSAPPHKRGSARCGTRSHVRQFFDPHARNRRSSRRDDHGRARVPLWPAFRCHLLTHNGASHASPHRRPVHQYARRAGGLRQSRVYRGRSSGISWTALRHSLRCHQDCFAGGSANGREGYARRHAQGLSRRPRGLTCRSPRTPQDARPGRPKPRCTVGSAAPATDSHGPPEPLPAPPERASGHHHAPYHNPSDFPQPPRQRGGV